MDWMLMPLRKYAQFSGRSQRKEFWMWVLFTIILSIAAAIIDRVLGYGQAQAVAGPNGVSAFYRSSGPVSALLTLALLLPGLAVSVRRLHDIDRTGWWLLVPFALWLAAAAAMIGAGYAAMTGTGSAGAGLGGAFLIGVLLMLAAAGTGIVLLVFYCLDGTRGPNRFGADPKGLSTDELADRFG